MDISQKIGLSIMVALFFLMFSATAMQHGINGAFVVWLCAVSGTALFVLALVLVTGDLKL